MTNQTRPTPHVAIRRAIEALPGVHAANTADHVVASLDKHGYFIVHRDDVPRFPDPKECPVCGEWFTYQTGQSTGKRHRSDAVYCTKRCADRASYLRRKSAPPRREMNA